MGKKTFCGWARSYAESPEIFDAFVQAEDPAGQVFESIMAAWPMEGQRVLEVGCGTGRLGAKIAKHGRTNLWVALDLSAPILKIARKNCPQASLIRARSEQLPHPDSSFDAIFSAWVFPYLRPAALQKSLAECERVLRPGGTLWLVGNEDSGPRGTPRDEKMITLMDSGFHSVADIETELRFPDQEIARKVTRYLMGPTAPEPDARGRIPHRVYLLRRDFCE